jgi:predicted RNase H-like nuclease (RuvC/YqgF family)
MEPLHVELEIARTKLRNAVQRAERVETELVEAKAAAERLRAKVKELEQMVDLHRGGEGAGRVASDDHARTGWYN